MNLAQFIARSPLPEAIGLAILHSFWQGALLAIALSAVLAATRSARFRYSAACLALVALLTGFVVTLIAVLPATHHGLRVPAAVAPFWKTVPLLNASPALQLDFGRLIPWLAPVWLLGVALFYSRCLAGWFFSWRLRHRSLWPAPALWQTRLNRLAAEINLSRPVRLLESFFADTPLVLGHLRPALLVPLGFLAGLPTAQIEAILLHELAHIQRFDYLLNVCQCLVEGLLFYHPAVWWISRIIRAEREHCCDDAVLAHRPNPFAYAAALTELETNRHRTSPPGALAVAAKGGNLKKRIERLLYPAGSARIWPIALAATVLLLTSSALFAAWQTTPATPATTWDRWLNEDVVYIITDQERASFLHLTTDQEREHFVEEFWARRDSKYKQEHYRRIAYANRHYTTAGGTAGWKTDRGHIYIVYGPPDEIDSHPYSSARSYGFEDWKYVTVPGLEGEQNFSFVDRTGDGDYRLGPANTAIK